MVAVTSRSSDLGAGLAEAVAASRSAGGALTLAATAISARGEEDQNHTAAITSAAPPLANIRPNALRMIALPLVEFYAKHKWEIVINADTTRRVNGAIWAISLYGRSPQW